MRKVLLKLKCTNCNEFLGYWSVDQSQYVCSACRRVYLNRGGILDFLDYTCEGISHLILSDQLSSFATLPTNDEEEKNGHLRLSLLRSFLPSKSANNLKVYLDVGCGYGKMLVNATSHFDLAIGIDTDMQELQTAQTLLRDQKVQNVVLFRASALNLPFLPNQFDAVSCIQVLEHVSEPRKAISQLKQMIGRWGCLYLSTSNRFMLRKEPHTMLRGIGYLPRRFAVWYASWEGKCSEYSTVNMLSVNQVTAWLWEEFGYSYKFVRSGCHQSSLGKLASAFWHVPVLSAVAKWLVSDIEVVAWKDQKR